MTTTLQAERDRFLTLFGRLVASTTEMMEAMPADKREAVPVQNPSVRFGDRLSQVTAKSLFIHTIVAEHRWAQDLCNCSDGDVIPVPRDPVLTETLSAGDYLKRAGELHEDNVRIFAGFTDSALSTHITFNESAWTVMGLLWGVYSHRAFHVGNIDIYVRQFGVTPADFFNFAKRPMA